MVLVRAADNGDLLHDARNDQRVLEALSTWWLASLEAVRRGVRADAKALRRDEYMSVHRLLLHAVQEEGAHFTEDEADRRALDVFGRHSAGGEMSQTDFEQSLFEVRAATAPPRRSTLRRRRVPM